MGSRPEVFQGQFDGTALSVAHGGPGMHARLTDDLREAGQMLTSMEMSRDGRGWNWFFGGRYRRIEGKPA